MLSLLCSTSQDSSLILEHIKPIVVLREQFVRWTSDYRLFENLLVPKNIKHYIQETRKAANDNRAPEEPSYHINMIQSLQSVRKYQPSVVEFPTKEGMATVKSDYLVKDASLAAVVERTKKKEIKWEAYTTNNLMEERFVINPGFPYQHVTIGAQLLP
ncbi:hypothetical protein Tco_0719894 [Tanacetum coccineum]